MPDSGRVVLFTGAGLGVPLGLPTTTGFTQDLQSGRRPVTERIMDYLADAAKDLEAVLSSLEGFAKDVAFTEFLLKYIVTHNSAYAPVHQQIAQFKTEASQEIRRIKKIIFSKLEEYKRDDAAALHFNLVRELRLTWPDSEVSIFTTNYDLTFEHATQSVANDWSKMGLKDFYFGFKSQYGLSVYDPSTTPALPTGTLEFVKLHGLLDWHRDSDGRCTRAGSATVPDEPDKTPILYPGYKEVPQLEPFATLHSRLHQRLMAAKYVVVVGFAFRDAYINSIFDNVLRSRTDLEIWYFNPLAANDFAEDSRLPYFVKTYKSFRHVPEAVVVRDEPLQLSSKIVA